MSSYSRQDVLRIFQISSHQLQGWVRAGLIPQQQTYTFQELGQLRTLRALREEDVPAASIRHSIVAMKAVAGMTIPCSRPAWCAPARASPSVTLAPWSTPSAASCCSISSGLNAPTAHSRSPSRHLLAVPAQLVPAVCKGRFLAAVQAEEAGEKQRAIALYEEILTIDPQFAAAYINLGTINFHLRQFARAEELYRPRHRGRPRLRAAFFDLGNVLDELQRLDESIAAYRRAVALAPPLCRRTLQSGAGLRTHR